MDDVESLRVRDVLLIILAGAVLGVVYNALLLQASPARAVTWLPGQALPQKVVRESGAAAPQDSIPPLPPPVRRIDPASEAGGTGVPTVAESRQVVVIRTDEARRFHAAQAALFVDARTPEEYAAGHIAGAVNLPLEKLTKEPASAQALGEGSRPIITYCDGPQCLIALDLAKSLVVAGKPRVLAFESGFPAWKEAGLPVNTGARP